MSLDVFSEDISPWASHPQVLVQSVYRNRYFSVKGLLAALDNYLEMRRIISLTLLTGSQLALGSADMQFVPVYVYSDKSLPPSHGGEPKQMTPNFWRLCLPPFPTELVWNSSYSASGRNKQNSNYVQAAFGLGICSFTSEMWQNLGSADAHAWWNSTTSARASTRE